MIISENSMLQVEETVLKIGGKQSQKVTAIDIPDMCGSQGRIQGGGVNPPPPSEKNHHLI